MGKSSKKSNVEAPDEVSVTPVKSAKKGGKRDSDQVIAKSASAKKQKVDDIVPKQSGKKSKKASIPEKKEPKTSGSEGKRDSDQVIAKSPSAKKQKVDAIVPKPSGKKSKKASILEKKEPKTSGSEDITSSESEEEKVDAIVPKPSGKKSKKASILEKKEPKTSGSEDITSSESEEEKVDAIVPKPSGKKSKKASILEKKEPKISGSEDITSSESEEEVRAPAKRTNKTVKAIEKEVSSSEESSDEDEDVKMDDPASNATGKQAATKKSEKKGVQTPSGNQNEIPASKTLFVGNLSYDALDVHLMEFFKEAGKVTDIRLPLGSDGQSKRFAHVEFADLAAAQKAIELSGQKLLGRAVKLEFARERGSYTPKTRGPNRTIFVRGFDKSQKKDQIESSLKEYFGSCGEITRVKLQRDFATGGPRGVAFMDFKDTEALTKALELNGTKLGDCALMVEEAKPRDRRGQGGGGGGGRGGGGGGGGGSGGP